MPLYFNFMFQEPKYFEINSDTVYKVQKYIQDKKKGISNNAPLYTKSIRYMDDTFERAVEVKIGSKIKLNGVEDNDFDRDEENSDDEYDWAGDMRGESQGSG